MSKFQLILMIIFGFFIVLAVAVFALYRGGSSNQDAIVTVWGDLPSEVVNVIINNSVLQVDESLTVRYEEKSSETIDREFTEALARGEGPDLIVITQERLWQNKSKLIPIPYDSISERDFQETFIEEGELFMSLNGIYSLPLAVDPMVLYHNRDLLSSAGEARPIAYWDEIYSLTSKLTQRDGAGNLVQSTVAMGETRNISNFKPILSLLMLQAGTPITAYVGDDLRPVMSHNAGLTVSPGVAALDFYTQFSNPSKTFYSWSRALPEAQTHFTSGDLVYYLGFASELPSISNKNPNLNFGIAPVPQSRVSSKKLTYGRLYGVSISRGTMNVPAALRAALILVSKDISAQLSNALSLPPARRDLLSEKQSGSVASVFYESALQSGGWIDPDPESSREAFESMIESVTSGRARTSESLVSANEKLESLIEQ